LTRAELVQVINLAPASAVEVHLIVEDCEERLNEQQVEQLIAVVARHLKAEGDAAANGGDAMQE
jgi:DNA-directed RNA polymerase subunit F